MEIWRESVRGPIHQSMAANGETSQAASLGVGLGGALLFLLLLVSTLILVLQGSAGVLDRASSRVGWSAPYSFALVFGFVHFCIPAWRRLGALWFAGKEKVCSCWQQQVFVSVSLSRLVRAEAQLFGDHGRDDVPTGRCLVVATFGASLASLLCVLRRLYRILSRCRHRGAQLNFSRAWVSSRLGLKLFVWLGRALWRSWSSRAHHTSLIPSSHTRRTKLPPLAAVSSSVHGRRPTGGFPTSLLELKPGPFKHYLARKTITSERPESTTRGEWAIAHRVGVSDDAMLKVLQEQFDQPHGVALLPHGAAAVRVSPVEKEPRAGRICCGPPTPFKTGSCAWLQGSFALLSSRKARASPLGSSRTLTANVSLRHVGSCLRHGE